MTFKIKDKTLILSIAILLVSFPVKGQIKDTLPPVLCQEKDSRIQVMLLGSYHMSNPGLDQFNLKADDVLAEKRQKELEKLSKRLALFKPAKIAVEAPFGDKSTMDEYSAYLESKRELGRSEREQIGFRLAKKLNHKAIFPIDVKMRLDSKALGPIVNASPKYQARMGELQKLGKGAITQMGKWLSEGTISYMLYQMNRPEVLTQAHYPYVWIFTPIAEGDNYAGADMVATWYNRNLRIFANLNRISKPGDWVLVVYGQGHIPILQDLVEDSPDFCSVDPLPYLRD